MEIRVKPDLPDKVVVLAAGDPWDKVPENESRVTISRSEYEHLLACRKRLFWCKAVIKAIEETAEKIEDA